MTCATAGIASRAMTAWSAASGTAKARMNSNRRPPFVVPSTSLFLVYDPPAPPTGWNHPGEPPPAPVGHGTTGGAAAVAVLCRIPVVVLPSPSEGNVVRLLLGLLLGVAGYSSGRTGGASSRSFVLGAAVLGVGIAVALVKNALSGH